MSNDGELHVIDFLVDTLDEFKDKVYELLLLVLHQVLICNQEAVVVPIDRLLSQNLELISTEREEALEHVSEEDFDLLVLLYRYGYADGVHRGFNEALFLIRLRYSEWVHEELGVVLELDLRVGLSLDELRWEVPEVEHRI